MLRAFWPACVYLGLDGEPCPRTSIRCGPAVCAQVDPARGQTFETIAPLEQFFRLAKQTLAAGENLVCRDAGLFGWPSGAGAVEMQEIRFYPLLNGEERKAVIAFGVVHCDEDHQPAPVVTEFVSRASIALENAFLYSALRDEDVSDSAGPVPDSRAREA